MVLRGAGVGVGVGYGACGEMGMWRAWRQRGDEMEREGSGWEWRWGTVGEQV